MSLGLVAQRGNDQAISLAQELRKAIGSAAVSVDEETGNALGIEGTPVEALSTCDLVASIGGDGTFLFAARLIGDTPIMGVNLGEVGFLTAVSPEKAVETIDAEYERARAGRLDLRTISRLEARNGDWTSEPALNELMVHAPQRGTDERLEVVVRIDGNEYDRSTVDGVMVATPTGSTAYNLSERGPLVTPGVGGVVVNQMCADHGRPPVVVPDEAVVEIDVVEGPFAYVVGDGRVQHQIDVPGAVRVSKSANPLCLAGPQIDFFEALNKLS